MNALILDIVHASRATPCIERRRVWRAVQALERVLRVQLAGSIACSCVADRTMKELNTRYRKKQRTTDVLSFCYTHAVSRKTHTLVGDIILSRAEALRQASERGMTFRAVIDELLIHAFLHLLGYDHERSAGEAKRMFEFQTKILQQMKIRN